MAVSASLGADVRKELFERGWAPRPTRIMHLPAGRGSMPTTLKHFVASPCYSQVFLEPGTGRDRAMAAAEAAGGDVDPALLKRQASALLQQVRFLFVCDGTEERGGKRVRGRNSVVECDRDVSGQRSELKQRRKRPKQELRGRESTCVFGRESLCARPRRKPD